MEPREKPKDPDGWRAFWRRNGRGVWKFWIDPANEHMICSTIVREENERDTGGRPIAINLPFNGWFRRARIVCMDDRIRNLLQHWSARLHGIEHTDTILIELRYHDRGRKHHDCVVLDVGRALQVIEMVATGKAQNPGLAGVIAHLGSALSCARRELDDAKQTLERAHEEGQRETRVLKDFFMDARNAVLEALERLRKSSRFVHSDDGLRLRISLLNYEIGWTRKLACSNKDEVRRLEELEREGREACAQLDKIEAAKTRRQQKARPSAGVKA